MKNSRFIESNQMLLKILVQDGISPVSCGILCSYRFKIVKRAFILLAALSVLLFLGGCIGLTCNPPCYCHNSGDTILNS